MLKKELEALVAEQAEAIESLRAQVAQANARSAEETAKRAVPSDRVEADGDVFDSVKRKVNAHGVIYNCRIAAGCERLNVAIAAKALGRTLNGRHSDVRTDRNDRQWIDFYADENTGSIDLEDAA